MPTPVHDAIAPFVAELIGEMSSSNSSFLSRDERKAIACDFGQDVALPICEAIPYGAFKGVGGPGGAVKQADAAIFFANRDDVAMSGHFPRIVFEVAFSQPYETLLGDAYDWLARSEGHVKLAIIIFLEEGSRAVGQTVDQESGNAEEPKATASGSQHINQVHHLTALNYQESLREDPTLWVGPVTGFIELYRYNSETGEVYQDGPRYDIFPPENTHETFPEIKISDLLPESHISGDSARAFPMRLGNYRYHITRGRHQLAANRRNWAQKGRQDDSYNSHITESC